MGLRRLWLKVRDSAKLLWLEAHVQHSVCLHTGLAILEFRVRAWSLEHAEDQKIGALRLPSSILRFGRTGSFCTI